MDYINCKLIKNKQHLLENAKILPCGNTGCLKCIQKVMNKTNYFKCSFQNCNLKHIITDVKKLAHNHDVDENIQINLKPATRDIIKLCKNLCVELKGMIPLKSFNHI